MSTKQGWRGRFFEDFEVGDICEHPLERTITTTDNAWFTLLTQNTAPIHFDHYYASQTEFGKPLVDSTFTVALVTGQSVTDVSQDASPTWDGTRSGCRRRSSKAIPFTLARRCWRSANPRAVPTWESRR